MEGMTLRRNERCVKGQLRWSRGIGACLRSYSYKQRVHSTPRRNAACSARKCSQCSLARGPARPRTRSYWLQRAARTRPRSIDALIFELQSYRSTLCMLIERIFFMKLRTVMDTFPTKPRIVRPENRAFPGLKGLPLPDKDMASLCVPDLARRRPRGTRPRWSPPSTRCRSRRSRQSVGRDRSAGPQSIEKNATV